MPEFRTGDLAASADQIRTIEDIQGTGLESPFAGETFSHPVEGVVTSYRDIYKSGRYAPAIVVQMPTADSINDLASDAVVVLLPEGVEKPHRGARISFSGLIAEVNDYNRDDVESSSTVVMADALTIVEAGIEDVDAAMELVQARGVKPYVYLSHEFRAQVEALQEHLGLEGPVGYREAQRLMIEICEANLFMFPKGLRASAPSNSTADGVFVSPEDASGEHASKYGTPMVTEQMYHRAELFIGFTWGSKYRSRAFEAGGEGFPSYDVGAALANDVYGPLAFRARGAQVVAQNLPQVAKGPAIEPETVKLEADPEQDVVLVTCNVLNFDPTIERPEYVNNPRRDVDDDLAAGRHTFAAKLLTDTDSLPTVVAFQELQVFNGAENIPTLDAGLTHEKILEPLRAESGIDYRMLSYVESWKTAGGQPHGSIHLGTAYDAAKLEVLGEGPDAIGRNSFVYDGTRKPTIAWFKHKKTGEPVVVVNVHQTSKRRSTSVLHKASPSRDFRDPTRVAQSQMIEAYLKVLRDAGVPYMVTGDFNDLPHGPSIKEYEKASFNVVPENHGEIADYIFRGQAQDLGAVIINPSDKERVHVVTQGYAQSLGVKHGSSKRAPSDHGSMWARMSMRSADVSSEDLALVRADANAAVVAWTDIFEDSLYTRPDILGSLSDKSAEWVALAVSAFEHNPDAIRAIGAAAAFSHTAALVKALVRKGQGRQAYETLMAEPNKDQRERYAQIWDWATGKGMVPSTNLWDWGTGHPNVYGFVNGLGLRGAPDLGDERDEDWSDA